jgi:hypothetical protein
MRKFTYCDSKGPAPLTSTGDRMFILRNKTSKALVLLSAVALLGSACDTDEGASSDGEDVLSEADAQADSPADALASKPFTVDKFDKNKPLGSFDAAGAPDVATPLAGDAVEETAAPEPPVMRTATFALG